MARESRYLVQSCIIEDDSDGAYYRNEGYYTHRMYRDRKEAEKWCNEMNYFMWEDGGIVDIDGVPINPYVVTEMADYD